MLTAEQNELLTRVGPGTPCGEMMRRYWHPIAAVSELEGKWTRRVRLLGEDLVLFRDKQGRIGLITEQCPHRRASLAYGIPTDDGIRCPYHGWEFGHGGQCLAQPNEPEKSSFRHKITTPAYSVEEMGGMFWAYMGPAESKPLLPRIDGFVTDGTIRMLGSTLIPVNWLQIMENSLDPIHTEWLHGHTYEFVKEQQGKSHQGRDQHAAREDRVPRVRARHHQAPPARRPLRGLRRLADRPPGGVPEHPFGRQRRRGLALLRVPDPRAGRRHPHAASLVHGLCAAEGRDGRAGTARQGARL